MTDEEVEPSLLNIQNPNFSDNMAGEGGVIYQTFPENGEPPKVTTTTSHSRITIRNARFSCCKDDIEYVSANGTFLYSKMIAELRNVEIREDSEVEKRPCVVPGVMLENYLKPMACI